MTQESQPALVIRGGPLEGRRFSLEAADEILIGSDAGCQVSIDMPGVSPMHARLWNEAGGIILKSTQSPRGLYLNDELVESEAPLREGDIISLGPPDQEGSVKLEYSHRWAETAAEQAGEAEPLVDPGPESTEDLVDPDPLELLTPNEPEVQADAAAETASPEVDPEPLEFVTPNEPEVAAGAATASLEVEPLPDEIVVEERASSADVTSEPIEPEMELLPAHEFMAAPAPPALRPPDPEPAAPPPPPAPPRPTPAGSAKAASVAKPAPVKAAAPPAAAPAKAAAPRPKAKPSQVSRYAALGAAVVIILGAAAYFVLPMLRTPELSAITPQRAQVGGSLMLTGKRFAPDAQGNAVLFGNDKAGRVVQATEGTLKVDVPEIPTTPGKDLSVPVRVRVGGRDSKPIEVLLYQPPRIQSLTPDVAMPGEEIVIGGSDWTQGAVVRFGKHPADVVETTPKTIKVKVPETEGGPGATEAVTVSMGTSSSTAAPFIVGRLPLVLSVEPKAAGAGDVVSVKGRGFRAAIRDNAVRIGGAPALVVSSADQELKAIVPSRAAEGEVSVEVRVSGSDHVGQGALSVAAAPDPLVFRFVAEPFEADASSEHDHAVLASPLGPVFVLSASGGRSAAERAVEAQNRLNAAAKNAPDADVELRGADSAPVIAVAGAAEALIDVTEEDAAAYNEGWRKRGPKDAPATRARLANWWTALARDLTLLSRGQKPQHAAALSAEGRVFGDVFLAAQKAGGPGVPRKVVTEQRPAVREAIRALALAVPASVPAPAPAAKAAAAPSPGTAPDAAASSETAPPPLKLAGGWTGSEIESGRQRPITVTFKSEGGSLVYEGAVSMTVALAEVVQQRETIRFSAPFRGGIRHYQGKWDGRKILGKISSGPGGGADLGTFELTPK